MNKKLIMLYALSTSLICQISQAQDQKKFMDDYFLGGITERTLIVRDIDELQLARETGRRAALLSRCANFRTIETQSGFDSYTEELQKALAAKSATLNSLNGFLTLSSAAALNEFSQDDIVLLKNLMAKPEYSEAISYLWFENVMRQMTDGLIDINTQIKQPWVAARALLYLKNHKLYPVFFSTLTVSEQELLSRPIFTSLQPAALSTEGKYTEELSQFFDEQLKSKSLLHALPPNTASLITQLQKIIDPEVKRANGVLHLLEDNPTFVCKSARKQNCVSKEWFKEAKSIFDANRLAEVDIAKILLNEKYSSLCKKNSGSSSEK